MSSVTIGGVEYVPASKLAREHRYTTDYIGQLCRGKKIDAQLVGRTWYVNPLSLNTHKKSRYTKVVSSDKTTKIPIHEGLSRIDVQPALSKSTVKMSEKFSHNFSNRLDTPGVRYEDDNLELLPQLERKNSVTKIAVDLADSTDIAIKNNSKVISMVATPMPEVSLTGELVIASLDDVYEVEEEKVQSVQRVLVQKTFETPVLAKASVHERPTPPVPLRPKFIKRSQVDRAIEDDAFTYKVPLTVSTTISAPVTTSVAGRTSFVVPTIIFLGLALVAVNFLVASELSATSLAADESFIFAPIWQ